MSGGEGRHVAFVGPGRAGLAVGYALARAGAVSSLTYFGRRPEPPAHPLFTDGSAEYVFGLAGPRPDTVAVFLSVPDAVIPEMAHTLAGQSPPPPGCVAFHLSGALRADVLSPLHSRGYAVGSFHPLQALADPVRSSVRLEGSWIALAGEPVAVATGRRLAAAMGAHVLTVPEAMRPAYHAAAVMTSNFLPPLLDAAARVLERSGVSPDDALPALTALARGTLANVEEVGVAGAVTGPVARGDVETVGLHLRALEGEERRIYAAFGGELLRLLGEDLPEDVRASLAELFERETTW